jgi:chromosome segregation ATPase
MELGLIITSVVLGIALILTILNCLKTKKKFKSEFEQKSKESDKLHSDLNRYNGIISIEKEIENKNSELAELQKTAKSFNESINDLQTLNSELDKLKNSKEIEEKELNEIQNKASNLNDRYTNAKSIFKELERDIKLYRNDLEFVELGIYEPIFDYETSEKYKEQLTNIRTKQKQLIKGGNACICNTNWHVGNSRKQGEIMTRRYINLTLRAFNGECDTLISKVKWNNVKRFEERITKAFNAINKLGKSNDVYITEKYLKLKLDELHLAYELEHKKQQEKEE